MGILLRLIYPYILRFDHEFETGIYPNFRSWIKQILIFLICWAFTKTIIIFIISFKAIGALGSFLLLPLLSTKDERIMITFVVLIIPLGLNILQAWMIDTLIKYKHISNDLSEQNNPLIE